MYRLPDTLRADLARPLAPVLSTAQAVAAVQGRLLVAVGDVCSREFLRAGVTPRVMLVDWKTQRTSDLGDFKDEATAAAPEWVKVANPAAMITRDLWDALEAAIARAAPTLIEVDGEEDLAALAALVLAPDDAAVAYGQPNEGVVVVTVTPDTRRHAQSLLDQMEVA